jgi:hypothetical protein
MKKMRFTLNLLAIGLLLIGLLGCKKEPRWLRIYCEGEFRDSIDVTGWEKNEDVVKINRYAGRKTKMWSK